MDTRTYYGETPLHLAAVSGHVEVVRALVAMGADVHTCDQDGQRALDKALDRNKHAVAVYLAAVPAEAAVAVEVDGETLEASALGREGKDASSSKDD